MATENATIRQPAATTIERLVDITQDWNLAEITASEAMRRILVALEEHSGETDAAATEARTIADLLDEIQRLTRYQGRVELRTMYFVGHTPANSEQPMAVFRGGDDDETDMPYYAALPEYGFLEGVGQTWGEALGSVVDALKAQESDR